MPMISRIAFGWLPFVSFWPALFMLPSNVNEQMNMVIFCSAECKKPPLQHKNLCAVRAVFFSAVPPYLFLIVPGTIISVTGEPGLPLVQKPLCPAKVFEGRIGPNPSRRREPIHKRCLYAEYTRQE